MITEILSIESMLDLYINRLLLPFMPILLGLLTLILTGIILNKILNHLYYIFIEVGSSKRLARKKVKVVCTFCKAKSTYDDLHDSFKM